MAYPEHVLAVRLILNLGPDWRDAVGAAIDDLADEEVDYLAETLIPKAQKLQLRTANKTAGGRGGIDYDAERDRNQHVTTIATLLGLPDPTLGTVATIEPPCPAPTTDATWGFGSRP